MRPVAPDGLSSAPRPGKTRLVLLGLLAAGSLAGASFLNPIPQDPEYHRFADGRTMFGIPNFLDVVSNIPFLVAGAFGLCNVLRKPASRFPAPFVRWPWVALTGSILLTGFGSPYYHWAPTDATLFWDRLPMALGFGAVLGIMVSERIDVGLGRLLWFPLLLAGGGSLLFWRLGGDLRFYGLLQGWAIVLVPLILLLFPPRYSGTHHWFIVLGMYAVAKVFEVADAPVYRLGGFLSGHTLKHLFAGLASWFIYRHLRDRVELNRLDPPASGIIAP